MNHHLSFFAHAHAFRAYSVHILQRHVHNAALARRHGIQPEGLAGSLHALRGNTRGHAQFFKTQGAVAPAIDVNLFVEGRFQPQRPEGQVFERFQNFRASLQQNLLILAIEIGEHFRAATRALNRHCAHIHVQLQSGNTHHILQKMAQGFGRRLPV